MIPETVSNPRYRDFINQGRHDKYLVLELDGGPEEPGVDVWLYPEQRLLDRYGVIVFVPNPTDADDERYLRYTAILPAETDAQGLVIRASPQELRGATADPRVVNYFLRFFHDLQSGRWRPGPLPEGKL